MVISIFSLIIFGAVFAYLLYCTAMYVSIKTRLVTIEDDAPADDKPQSKALKLSNELEPFYEFSDNKIKLTVLKKKN